MILYLPLVLGIIISSMITNVAIQHIPGYESFLYLLLGIGLYGAVCGIDLREFSTHRNLILRAVTFGVLLKSFIIGGIMWLAFQTPYAFLFGIIVAQIDPLSVAHLIDKKAQQFSQSGRTILRAWAAFDDPMTVLLALYLFLSLAISQGGAFSFTSYVIQLAANIALALCTWIMYRQMKYHKKILLLLLGIVFLIAIPLKLMLGIALIALFLRPNLPYLHILVQGAFIIAAAILGLLLEINYTSLLYGIALGNAAFLAQMLATFFVAPKLNKTDKIFLALAQYNGITSIILALIIAQWIPETVSIIAFAVITINTLYYVTNFILSKYLQLQK